MPQHQPGSYWGRPIRAVLTELGANKSLCFVMTFDVTHSADGNGGWVDLPNPEQRDVKLFCTDNAWPYTEKQLKAFGFNGDFASPVFSDEFKAGAEIVCEHEFANNKTYENWNFPRGDREAKPVGSDAVRLMNAKWKTNNTAAQKPPGAPPAPPVRRVVHQGRPPSAAATATATAPSSAPASAPAADDDGPPF